MFWQMLGVCLVGSWLASGQEKKRKNLQERRKQWLEENGCNRKKQLELELWAMKNKCEAIEAAYGYPRDSIENDRMYIAWINKSLLFLGKRLWKSSVKRKYLSILTIAGRRKNIGT